METYFDYLKFFVAEYGEKNEQFMEYLQSTDFKFRLQNGNFDPYSFRFWSWGQDIQTYDIAETTQNVSEACNARLNRDVITTYQIMLNSNFHDFHNLFPESLIDYLLKCSTRIAEAPEEPLEKHPQDNENSSVE